VRDTTHPPRELALDHFCGNTIFLIFSCHSNGHFLFTSVDNEFFLFGFFFGAKKIDQKQKL
jgi:hypothetical protein